MVRTLYYAITIRYIGLMANEGFLRVKLEEDNISSIEGVLTEDYIVANIKNDVIILNYYVKEEDIGEYKKEFAMELSRDDIELPLHLIAESDFITVEINTKYKILKSDEKFRCDRILSELKNNVFGEERG